MQRALRVRRVLQMALSLVMYVSDKAESPHSGFSDATIKTTEHQRKWRQKKPQGAPVLVGSEKAECGDSVFSNEILRTTKQEKATVKEVEAEEASGLSLPSPLTFDHWLPTKRKAQDP